MAYYKDGPCVDQVQEKMHAAQQPGIGGALGSINNCKQVPLMEQLHRQAEELAQRHGRILTLIENLTRHPEFEEFIDFQDLLSRRNY